MNTPPTEVYVLPRWMRSWEQFWFAPGDPTVLALVRIGCGLIVVYALLVYSFRLQEFHGEHGWHDLATQRQRIEERPVFIGPLVSWQESGPLPAPKNDFERTYLAEYTRKNGLRPPAPYPTSEEQAKYLDDFLEKFKIDLRVNGLKPSDEPWKRVYADEYTTITRQPPPAYPKDVEEAKAIAEYYDRTGVDPRRLYAKGQTLFSFWFHITDPTSMAIVHGLIVFVAILFTVGFCTRLTSAFTWFAYLGYIHRNPTVLFGVDTMITIMLMYLMIGPSGAAYSVDRLIRKWWVTAKPGVVQWWYGLLRMPVPSNLAPADPVPDEAPPSIGANVAIRLLQIHVCFVYLFSGLSKLQGPSWWTGDAIWMTLGNFEFAPMQFDLYIELLRFLGGNQLLYNGFMTVSALFTLGFEIGYAYLIWRPRLRWVFLGSAIALHGGIGLFMGLKTFSLAMLVMNMAFLRKEEAAWIFSVPASLFSAKASVPPTTTAGK